MLPDRQTQVQVASALVNDYITGAGLPDASGALFSGPYRSLRELSLAELVGSVTRCPPTCVGNPGSLLQRPARLRTHFPFSRARCGMERSVMTHRRPGIVAGAVLVKVPDQRRSVSRCTASGKPN